MSTSKRDKYEYRRALTSGRAAPRPIPVLTASWPQHPEQPLRVQGSWNEDATQGNDPYNTTGSRAVGTN